MEKVVKQHTVCDKNFLLGVKLPGFTGNNLQFYLINRQLVLLIWVTHRFYFKDSKERSFCKRS